MYLKSISLENVKCFADVKLEFTPREDGSYAGWHVLLGENATGKTTLLQAMAAVLVGPAPVQQLLRPAGWVRKRAQRAELRGEFVRSEGDEGEAESFAPTLYVTGEGETEIDGRYYAAPQIVLGTNERKLVTGPYAVAKKEWFVSGYGAHRRLSGGSADDAALVDGGGREGRIVSLFRESAALDRGLEWLSRFVVPRALLVAHGERDLADFVPRLMQLVNQLLPPSIRLAKVGGGVAGFRVAGSGIFDLPDMSDGYRGFLALVLDLLRLLDDAGRPQPLKPLEAWDFEDARRGLPSLMTEHEGRVHIPATGVVLIDEVDLHLHPTWQRELGPRLCEVFPNIQFIVTSHSPFIAQAASPGGLFVLHADEATRAVSVFKPPYQVGGWRVDQILVSPLFGLTDTRDPETQELLEKHASLVGRGKSVELDESEQRSLAEVEAALAQRLTSPGEDLASRKREQAMEDYVDDVLARLDDDDAAAE